MTEESKKEDSGCPCSRRFWIGLIALTLLLVGVTGVTITCFVLEQKVLQYRHHYGVIFDAGSSHTDITVYRWPSEYKDHGTAHTEQITFQKCSDVGISSYETNPDLAGDMIRKCIDTVALKKLPSRDVKKTAIYVGATAGMRLLCERNEEVCDEILNSIRHALNGYKFRQTKNRVRVLTGKEEGSFGWITANLLHGALNNIVSAENNSKLIGALDMGGASAEITFIPKNKTIPDDYHSQLTLYGVNYTLYTNSYLCYGFKEAQRRLMAHLVEASNYTKKVIHPCWHKGYNETVYASWVWLAPCSSRPNNIIFPIDNRTIYRFIGNGTSGACENRIKELFNETTCRYGNCTFDRVYQPPLRGHFMAYSGYGHIGSFLNMSKGDQIRKMKEKGETFCAKEWPAVWSENKDNVKRKYLRSYCFEALYSYEILTHGLRFPPESSDVYFTNDMNGTEVGWSLGFMVNTTNSIPEEAPTYRLTQQEFVAVLVVCCLMALLGLAMLTICLLKKKLKKNMKYKYNLIK